ncbi:hypothetical protein GHK46_26355 [Sinorhizobium medicae]|uniref:hypothetical protein n=1 Tax=Sinorhizobium medicae TaxID=110321 RepID=UPI0012963353|nr:hypothetical protein [Sinorhizobium medicae]MQW00712.1 hypothetical protein [Sinorhizobium medicae]
MQKINVSSIVAAHTNTLRDDKGHLQFLDVATFFVLPVLLGGLMAVMCWQVPEKALELSISVFSIFAALLLSVQVALYSVSLREIAEPEDQRKKKDFEDRQKLRKILIKELNDNVSYLILLSVVTVTVTLALFFTASPRIWGSAIAVALYSHFLLTILMVIKRASIVFSREYEQASQ